MVEIGTRMERAAAIAYVDSEKLLGDRPRPATCPDLGVPSGLTAFVVSADPKITVIPHFFSQVECEHLMCLVDGCWIPSLVGEATYSSEAAYQKGDLENTLSKTRTSWSCMMRYKQTQVVERLEQRVASLAGVPMEQLERMNMVRYGPGELFNEHHDGKFRPRTVFVYLNELPEAEDAGGDTFFPILGLSFRPRQGTAIMWSNVLQDGTEDARMLHAGRAPTRGVKYGVNCFINCTDMRVFTPANQTMALEDAVTVHVGDLIKNPDDSGALQAFRLLKDPSLSVVPGFLSAAEVDHLLERVDDAIPAPGGPFAAGTQTLRVLAADESSVVHSIEVRMAATTGLALDYLARLRIVRPGGQLGLCNRGCGQRSMYVCLSGNDEVFFPHLGLRVVLRARDAIIFDNSDWSTGSVREDVRSSRVHLKGSGSVEPAAIGLEGHFHDSRIREQQRQRAFVPDSVILAEHIVPSPGLA